MFRRKAPDVQDTGRDVVIRAALIQKDSTVHDDGAIPVAAAALQFSYLCPLNWIVDAQAAPTPEVVDK